MLHLYLRLLLLVTRCIANEQREMGAATTPRRSIMASSGSGRTAHAYVARTRATAT